MKNFVCQYLSFATTGLTSQGRNHFYKSSTLTEIYNKNFHLKCEVTLHKQVSIFVTFTIARQYASTFNPINLVSWSLTNNSKPHKHPLPRLLIHYPV